MTINVSASAAALRAKLNAAKGVSRADMYLADVQPVSASSAKLLIGYNPRFGTPSHEQVTDLVTAATLHRSQTGPLGIQLETLCDHPVNTAKAAVSVVVSAPRLTADISAKNQMVALSSTMFMDERIHANWEIKTGPDGTKHLECMRKEDVPSLLNTAIASQGVISRGVSFTDPEIQAVAAVQCNVGDFVEFWADGGLHRGDVTSCGEDEINIHGDDKQWKVSRAAVTKTLRLNTKAANDEKKRQKAVFSAIWGENFAKQLVG